MSLDIAELSAVLDQDEATAVQALGQPLDGSQRAYAMQLAKSLVAGARERSADRSYLDAFLLEFGLSNPEGISLMCLAESLLRIPDDETADRLIAEKLAAGDWSAHSGRSESLFVNASTWGLMLTGRLVELPLDLARNPGGWFSSLVRRAGEPLVRQALRRAMQIMGEEFVVGRDIQAALRRGRSDQALARCSFDMLGEGARSLAQAEHYHAAYTAAIHAIGASSPSASVMHRELHDHHAISIKLSALEPRYTLLQMRRIQSRLIPKVLELARLAAHYDMGLTIDAEEADRLEISLTVMKALAEDRQTRHWSGLGLAVQAYGLRAPAVIDWIADLAGRNDRSMSLRLVKGAYWDSEIKRAQERGLSGYPVYTRKSSTDLAYLACAQRLLACGGRIYPQFATHNAHTIAAVLALRAPGSRFEFQRLHGMGKLLYDEAQRQIEDFPAVRVYAPVGPHAELLAYLVRRLLENGANTSFVNRFLDADVPVDAVVVDPITELARIGAAANPRIPLPAQLFAPSRKNSRGVDLGRSAVLQELQQSAARRDVPHDTKENASTLESLVELRNPADHREIVGTCAFATAHEVTQAFATAAAAQPDWNALGAIRRAEILHCAADALEVARADFIHLLVREAGKTIPDAVAEIREAADFCRYYAVEARRLLAIEQQLRGPTGERNTLSLQGRGVVACISPWNFPLAIFIGQVAAALAAGNAVVAKPAEATPLVAQRAVQLLHNAGVPQAVLHGMPMHGRAFGEVALSDPHLAGVVFTGSTATAQWLNRALAAREGAILPLIAETGGLNAMLVDSTALPEQVVDDVIVSAFGSAGQRCSALRLLCVQEDIADRLLELLEQAMDELVVGDPADLSTDIGPVISKRACESLGEHVEEMRVRTTVRKELTLPASCVHGSFFPPTLIKLESVAQLKSEQFGPILHVVRFAAGDEAKLLAEIRNTGYALTMGVQTRIEGFWREAFANTFAGNVYVNRNMIGAVVGVQPFGGSGLSGTGPKAGGPHYLARLAVERVLTVNETAVGGNTELMKG
jgi:RHH-type transcriptional regulator, proline utilization regulon repressor / proline dehydrogenase / delta 1-pyrroline-5-carboxylate dehydrogenase